MLGSTGVSALRAAATALGTDEVGAVPDVPPGGGTEVWALLPMPPPPQPVNTTAASSAILSLILRKLMTLRETVKMSVRAFFPNT
jgi:hypothetical protein